MDATEIHIEWNKPYTNPSYDIIGYILRIQNMSSNDNSTVEEIRFPVNASTEYPIRYYYTNESDVCHYLNFSLGAYNGLLSDINNFIEGFSDIGKLDVNN